MPSVLKDKFAQRVEQFFKLRRINIDGIDVKAMTDYLYNQFEKQGRFKEGNARFTLTPKFIMPALSSYLKMNPMQRIELFRDNRLKRNSVNYNIDESLPTSSYPKGLIQLLGRKHKPEYKITKTDGSALTPTRIQNTKECFASFSVGFSPLNILDSYKGARKRAKTADNSVFERDMFSDDLALWRKNTPQKNGFFSPYRVKVAQNISEKKRVNCKPLTFSYDAEAKKETKEQFQFSVTREDILDRIGAKRPISQKRVMGNVSAIEVMKEIGVIITEKQNGRSFHWAHRRGWSLHGEQEKENFDPMTAGSNYDTLFKLESPLKKLLLEQEMDEVLVQGEVDFDKEHGLPFKVTYKLSWGTLGFIEVIIDPMSHRVPTVNEHEIAKTFFDMTVG